jgi:TPR repeat protein
MLNQYPQILESTERFEREEKLLYKISLEGYDEVDIDDIITDIQLLKEAGKLAEAAHLLLIIAFTESLYAQLIFARELYKGEILQKDVPEAFTQINRLAIENYPEAICDLAQFYEKGIGINKDKKKAFRLYEDALELGVLRAERHIVRMQEESKGFFGKLFN